VTRMAPPLPARDPAVAAKRILIVEDNAALAAGLRYNLELEGFDVTLVEDGREAPRAVGTLRPDLVVLDLMLPGLDGFEVLERVRAAGHRMPVLILSARAEEADKVRGFRLDADQYVTKPFGLLELIERVKALLRRADSVGGAAAAPSAAGARAAHAIAFGRVRVDPAARAVTRDGIPVSLTPKAYELMLALVRRNGAVATRVELLSEVWGTAADVVTRTVDSHMAELRRKLEDDPGEPRHFLTVWKAGYRFTP
jgi:two-component system, OmpR family, alkaline phosphatase synthesis response regulator PhoP